MQAVLDNAAMPRGNVLFARRHGRDYMMRSEKRSGYNATGPSGGRPPKRRRKRAGFFYILLTLLLSVLLWPIGMLMLWQRRLRWKSATKLLTSLTTLVLCVTLFGFALTVQTDNPEFTRAQDSVNDFLDQAVVKIGDGYGWIYEKSLEVWDTAADMGDALVRIGKVKLADGLDAAASLSASVHENLFAASSTDAPELTASPETTDAPEATTVAPTQTPTPAPTRAIPTGVPMGDDLNIVLPETSPDADSALPIGEGMLNRDRELTTAAPTQTPAASPDAETGKPTAASTNASATAPSTAATTDSSANASATAATTDSSNSTSANATAAAATTAPTPTAAPTDAPVLSDDVQPLDPADLVVYYNDSGVNYHWSSSCKGMKSAKAGTLGDAVAKGLRRCKNCGTPDASVLEIENAVWTDENSHFHLTNACEEFHGDVSVMSLTDAVNHGYLPCVNCKAAVYMTASGVSLPTPTPAPTATPSPSPTPSPTPAPELVAPTATLKPAAEALLYHSSNGGWYHTYATCSGMGGAKLYTLESCVEDGLKYCKRCNAPKPELLEEYCLWMDEQEICHTSDECTAFDGDWTLIPRDDALSEGYKGCEVCGADEYLIENTIITYSEK